MRSADREPGSERMTEYRTEGGARAMSDWRLVYDGFDPEAEGLARGAVHAGERLLGDPGAAPESTADGVHYPGTYAPACTTAWPPRSPAGRSATRAS